MKTICESDGNWPSHHTIASKIFSMLKLLLQVIANHSNVHRKSIASQLRATCVRGLNGDGYRNTTATDKLVSFYRYLKVHSKLLSFSFSCRL